MAGVHPLHFAGTTSIPPQTVVMPTATTPSALIPPPLHLNHHMNASGDAYHHHPLHINQHQHHLTTWMAVTPTTTTILSTSTGINHHLLPALIAT